MNNIGVFGLGCIGSVLSKYLMLNKNNVCYFFNRSKKSYSLVSFRSCVTTISIDYEVLPDIELDWLIICIKEYHYQEAISHLQSLITAKTKVAVFRNGLDLALPLKTFVPTENILETIIDCPVQLNEKGEYLQFRNPIITLPKSTLALEFTNLFVDKEIQFQLSNDFNKMQWEKLIESSSIGSIQALTKRTCSVFQEKKYEELYINLVKEGIDVANSKGAHIDENFLKQLLDKLHSYPNDKSSSMLMDKLAEKKLELNAKIGIIYKLGLIHNISIPKTEMIYKALIE